MKDLLKRNCLNVRSGKYARECILTLDDLDKTKMENLLLIALVKARYKALKKPFKDTLNREDG